MNVFLCVILMSSVILYYIIFFIRPVYSLCMCALIHKTKSNDTAFSVAHHQDVPYVMLIT